MKEELIAEIIDLEWAMFDDVRNVGGRAWCQNDPATFRIMRTSQAKTWGDELLASYRDDLVAARSAGRNLMTEKYARMMESTHPEEYALIAEALLPVDAGSLAAIEEIVAINVGWEEAVAAKYPRLSAKGRPLHTGEDTPQATSFETYARGELRTYSPKTIGLLREHTMSLARKEINGAELVLQNMVEAYGYKSLAEANDRA